MLHASFFPYVEGFGWSGFPGGIYDSSYRRVPPPLSQGQAQIEMRQDETTGTATRMTLAASIYDGVIAPTHLRVTTGNLGNTLYSSL